MSVKSERPTTSEEMYSSCLDPMYYGEQSCSRIERASRVRRVRDRPASNVYKIPI